MAAAPPPTDALEILDFLRDVDPAAYARVRVAFPVTVASAAVQAAQSGAADRPVAARRHALAALLARRCPVPGGAFAMRCAFRLWFAQTAVAVSVTRVKREAARVRAAAGAVARSRADDAARAVAKRSVLNEVATAGAFWRWRHARVAQTLDAERSERAREDLLRDREIEVITRKVTAFAAAQQADREARAANALLRSAADANIAVAIAVANECLAGVRTPRSTD